MELEGEMDSKGGRNSRSGDSTSGGVGDGGRRMRKRRRSRKLWLFGRLKIKDSWRWRWRYLGSAFRWKGHAALQLQLSFFEDVLFKIVSVLEAVVLVATLCFFYLCCGCRI